jgi:hypothetical protein
MRSDLFVPCYIDALFPRSASPRSSCTTVLAGRVIAAAK